MAIHIGQLIRKRVEETGMSKSEFARRVNTTSQNIYGIFKRKSLDTELLTKISSVLKYDFFQHYSHEPLLAEDHKRASYKTRAKLITTKTLAELTAELENCQKELELFRKENAYLKKINELLEKKQD